jgi:hypothetical protein
MEHRLFFAPGEQKRPADEENLGIKPLPALAGVGLLGLVSNPRTGNPTSQKRNTRGRSTYPNPMTPTKA